MDMLTPKFYDVYFLIERKLLNVLTQAIEIYMDNKKIKIVDIACGTKPYFPLFKKRAKEYIGIDIDIKKTEFVDIIGSAEKLPFVDSHFDVALSTQALEHIRDYRAAVDEMYRVLKPEGIVFLSTHGVWEVHGAPHDYWRFTEYGLKEVFKQYREVQIIKNGGAILCFFQIFNIYLYKLNKYPFINLIAKFLIVINNLLGWHLDKLLEKYDFFVVNYLVVAKK
jgi:ubiquinone/menaquinone biosynthesis C-methylase UbiE